MAGALLSADSHVFEPADLWETRLDRRFRGRAPRFVTDERNGRLETFFVCEGLVPRPISIAGATGVPKDRLAGFECARHADLRPGGWDPAARRADQELDGVAAEVLYPTFAMQLFALEDAELQEAAFEAYNGWLAELCARDPGRLAGLALIPVRDPARGAAALERWSARGLRGGVIAGVPPEGSEYGEERYDPLWAAAEAAGVPLSLHTLTSGRRPAHRFERDRRGAARYPEHPMQVMLTLGELLTSPAMDRRPGLKLVVAEADAGWLPWLLARLDRGQEKYGERNGVRLERRPSEYFRRGVWAAFIQDRAAVLAREQIGTDRLLWSSDYPHTDSTWPRSRESVARDFAGVPDADRRAITWTNAARLYGFPDA